MKKSILLAKEYYETFERLKYNEDFIEFKKVVDQELVRLDEKIKTAVNKDDMFIDVQIYKKLKLLFEVWFDNAEREAKSIRSTVKKRDSKKQS